MDVDAEAQLPAAALLQHPDVIAASIRARDWSAVPERLRGWAINDEIMMSTVDANAIGLANNAAALGALVSPDAVGAGSGSTTAQSACAAGMVPVNGTFGDVSRLCYDASGHQLAASIRWSCTFHNQLELQRMARGYPPCGRAPLYRHCVRLRAARPRMDDMRFVMDMIRGLAVYEKEPDAVHTSEESMLTDGFGPGRQFQVIIAEVPAVVDHHLRKSFATSEEGKKEGFPTPAPLPHAQQVLATAVHPDPTAGVAAEGYVPLAFAFTHGAYSTWEGRVIYLEDLYVQPYARRMGLSSMLLQAVARAGHVSKCARVQWSALDWNKQAIDAYVHPRVGATPLTEWTLYRLWRKDIERVSALQVHFNR